MTPRRYDWEDDEETEDDSGELDFDSDEFDFDDEDDDEDDDEVFANIERAFRQERAAIRACDDLHELRRLRATHQALANSGARDAGRIRARDLVELIDDRITDLKARRMARRSW